MGGAWSLLCVFCVEGDTTSTTRHNPLTTHAMHAPPLFTAPPQPSCMCAPPPHTPHVPQACACCWRPSLCAGSCRRARSCPRGWARCWRQPWRQGTRSLVCERLCQPGGVTLVLVWAVLRGLKAGAWWCEHGLHGLALCVCVCVWRVCCGGFDVIPVGGEAAWACGSVTEQAAISNRRRGLHLDNACSSVAAPTPPIAMGAVSMHAASCASCGRAGRCCRALSVWLHQAPISLWWQSRAHQPIRCHACYTSRRA